MRNPDNFAVYFDGEETDEYTFSPLTGQVSFKAAGKLGGLEGFLNDSFGTNSNAANAANTGYIAENHATVNAAS